MSNTGNEIKPHRNGKFRLLLRTLPFAISTVFRSGPFLLPLLVIVTIMSGLMPAVTIYVGKLVLDAIVNVVQTGTGSAAVAVLVRMLGIQLLVLLGGSMIDYVSSYLSYLMGRRLSLNMNIDIITKASTLDYEFFENSRFYDMMTRARRESSGRPLALLLNVTSIIRGTITFASMSGLILTFGIPLFFAMVIVCLPLLFVQLKYGQKNYALQYNRTEDMRMAGYVSGTLMARHSLPEVISFGLWGFLFKKWYAAALKFFYQDVRLQKHRTITEGLSGILLTSSKVAATGYIIFVSFAKKMSLTVGDIMMYAGAFSGGISGFRTAIGGVASIYENALFGDGYAIGRRRASGKRSTKYC